MCVYTLGWAQAQAWPLSCFHPLGNTRQHFFPCPSLWVATGPVEKEVGHNQRADCVRAIVLFGTKGSLVLWAESETGVWEGDRGRQLM